MFIVHATRKLLARVGQPNSGPDERSTTALEDWYATALFWRPQVALFVNESTLLPVLIPLAPAATVTQRFRRRWRWRWPPTGLPADSSMPSSLR